MADLPIHHIHDWFSNRTLRSFFLKMRIPLGIVLFFFLLFHLEKEWFLPGLVVSILGELLQLWCFATIKTKKQLTTGGPYMFVRNPMYIGRYFLIAGILLMTGSFWTIAAFSVVYYFYMVNRVRREEQVLKEIFGIPYEAYCLEVNRYIPSLIRFDMVRLFGFDAESFRQNNGTRNMIVVGAAYLLLYFFTFVYPIG